MHGDKQPAVQIPAFPAAARVRLNSGPSPGLGKHALGSGGSRRMETPLELLNRLKARPPSCRCFCNGGTHSSFSWKLVLLPPFPWLLRVLTPSSNVVQYLPYIVRVRVPIRCPDRAESRLVADPRIVA
jgi:hypothetical protein